MLEESRRQQLDDIIRRMESNGENRNSIDFVVNDFKNKYSTQEPQKSFLEKTSDVLDMVFGGKKIGEYIGTKIAEKSSAGKLLKQQEAQGIAPQGTFAETFKKPTAGELAGSALQSAALFIPAGAGAKAITTGARAIGLKTGASALGKIGAGALAGEVFDVASNLQQGKTGSEVLTPGLGALIGGAIPAAGVAKNIVVRFGDRQAPRVINSLIKPLAKDFSYGKNPGRAVAEEGIIANNFDDLINGIRERRQAIGQEIGTLSEKLSTQPILSVRNSLSPLEEATKIAASQNNQALLSRISNVKRAITEVLEPYADNTGNLAIRSLGSRDLDNLTFKQARNILSDIGDLTAFTGNPSDDKLVNSALKQVYGKIKEETLSKANEINPQLASQFTKLTEKYADLSSAEIASKYRDKILERQNLVGLSPQTVGIGTGLITAIATGGATIPAVLAGLTGAAIDKLASTPGFKTRLAYLLSTKTQSEARFLFNKIPALKKFFTLNEGATPGDVILGKVRNELKDAANLPNKQGGFIKIGKEATQSKPVSKVNESVSSLNDTTLIKEAKKYKSAEEFVKAQGTPVYHGTNTKFDNFDISKSGYIQKSDWGNGIYLEPHKGSATTYANIATERKGGSPNVMEVLLDKNAKIYHHNFERTLKINEGLADTMKAKGYDAISIDYPSENMTSEIVVMNPKILKTKSQLEQIWKEANKTSLKNNKQAGFVNLGLDEIKKRKPMSGDSLMAAGLTIAGGLGALNKIVNDQLPKVEQRAYEKGIAGIPQTQTGKNEPLQSFVPEQYKETIKSATKGLKVTPKQLAALIQSENGQWKPDYVNPAGSDTGLGQHNDATYKDINALFKKKYGRSYDRKNAEDSIKATALWLNELQKKEGINTFEDAVKAYRIGVNGLKALKQGKRTPKFSNKQLKELADTKLQGFSEFMQ